MPEDLFSRCASNSTPSQCNEATEDISSLVGKPVATEKNYAYSREHMQAEEYKQESELQEKTKYSLKLYANFEKFWVHSEIL